MKAMILAAGRGKRLRPLTDTIPKPLIEINQKALIEYHLEKLAQIGVKQVVINYAWLGEQFPARLGDGSKYGLQISYSPEPEGGLETAGGLVQALPILTSNGQDLTRFLVINADVFTDFDYAKLPANLPPEVLAHLVLVPTPDYKEQGDFGLQTNNQPGLVTANGDLTFAGISLIDPKLLENLAVGFHPLAPILRQAMAKELVTGELFTGQWHDIGTPERLEQLRAEVAQQA